MNRRLTLSFVSAVLLALAATGLVIKSNPAIAQQADEEMLEIVVEAPIVHHTVERGALGAKIEVIQLSRRVSFADLDLSEQVNVTELETRIKTTAKESCEQLSDMFLSEPSGRREIRRCTNLAVKGTEEHVQAAVAAAS